MRKFENTLNDLQDAIHGDNVVVGWWDGIDKQDVIQRLSKCALIHTEVSEAVEGFRKGLMDDHLPHREMAEVELADAVIRIFDLAGACGYQIGDAIMEKLEYNRNRADHKRENRAKDGGKKA